MAHVEIDESRWPRVYVKWPVGPLTDEEFKQAVTRLSDFTRRRQPYVTILDARNSTRPTPLQRRFAAERQRLDAEYSSRWLLGSAIVVSNPVLVGVITAINWVFPPPYPQKIFASLAAAEVWIEQQIHSMSPPQHDGRNP
jgi:hypothetical protein